MNTQDHTDGFGCNCGRCLYRDRVVETVFDIANRLQSIGWYSVEPSSADDSYIVRFRFDQTTLYELSEIAKTFAAADLDLYTGTFTPDGNFIMAVYRVCNA